MDRTTVRAALSDVLLSKRKIQAIATSPCEASGIFGSSHYRAYVSGFAESKSGCHGGTHHGSGFPSLLLGVSAEHRTPGRHQEYLELRFTRPKQELGRSEERRVGKEGRS